MKLNNAVLRLIRVGDKNSLAWQRISESIDKLAETLSMYFPGGGQINQLPHNSTFQHWPSGEYCLTFPCYRCDGIIMRENKRRNFILALCQLIAKGWLDEVSDFLEKETKILIKAEGKIDKFSSQG